MTAREEAALALRQHLTQSAQRDPEALHVVVAHSHGGTVASLAILDTPLQLVAIRALVCLATPFARLIKPSLPRLQTALLAVVSLLYSLYWTAICALFPSIGAVFSPVALAAVIGVKGLFAFLLVVIVALGLAGSQKTAAAYSQPVPKFPIYLLRATRDEASLSLSMAQAFDWFCAGFARSHDVSQGRVRQPLSWVNYAVVYSTCAFLGVHAAKICFGLLDLHLPQETIGILGVFVYAPAIAGVAYISGYAALAIAVGHYKLTHWLTTAVEVDAAPPGVMCNLLVYSDLEPSSKAALRHGLYEGDAVIREIAALVAQASK